MIISLCSGKFGAEVGNLEVAGIAADLLREHSGAPRFAAFASGPTYVLRLLLWFDIETCILAQTQIWELMPRCGCSKSQTQLLFSAADNNCHLV